MTNPCVLFIQGGGKGAHTEDKALADSLKQALGAAYEVRFPQMPDEADPNARSWKMKISQELSRIPGRVILAAHSIGGSLLLKYLTEEKIEKPIAGLFVLAAPSWDGDRWNFDDLKLPADITEQLAPIPQAFFYHCRDDDTVPFAHLALHGARLPRATLRAIDHGGHQFDKDLKIVASDILNAAA
ncbi:alpha/beta hydrolase [Piscinibacter gummiphilus]|uniref:Alpha/beta hydrolase n=1 Tax=Piscinibacter gummiphilus TaxID=946333 RepID=A0ABZ0CVE1_9BURK|nr:alpha/beta hydrolase [Piscinibacter gummiphilus]WOB06912.1 alpha/beta hydrolase [Piscinibacter gummiphilus]